MEAWRWPHTIQDTGLSPVGQVLPKDEGMCGIGWKPQETMDVRMWKSGAQEGVHIGKVGFLVEVRWHLEA